MLIGWLADQSEKAVRK